MGEAVAAMSEEAVNLEMKDLELEAEAEAEIEVEMDKSKKMKKEDGSAAVVRWERFLPRMVLRVLLVEADDSTRQIIAALLRKCNYKGEPLFFHWLVRFHSLKDLSLVFSTVAAEFDSAEFNSSFRHNDSSIGNFDVELQLETLGLSGIRQGDYGLDWLWRSCKNLKKLQLRSCEGIGGNTSLSSFVNCLKALQEVELRTCRTIVDDFLSKLAKNCTSLKSLLVYDGCSSESLLQFITQSQCNLQKICLRLPLDLGNDHLLAIAENFRGLSCLRLQSCCLVTGEGLKSIVIALSNGLEELELISCDAVERVPGLLTTLGQNLRMLKKLDLSYNETMIDKEFTLMLVSFNCLRELKLRGCKGLTNASIVSMFRSYKNLECVDVMDCCGIEAEAVELLVLNCPQLRQVQVEETKLSDVARSWALNKLIEVI